MNKKDYPIFNCLHGPTLELKEDVSRCNDVVWPEGFKTNFTSILNDLKQYQKDHETDFDGDKMNPKAAKHREMLDVERLVTMRHISNATKNVMWIINNNKR